MPKERTPEFLSQDNRAHLQTALKAQLDQFKAQLDQFGASLRNSIIEKFYAQESKSNTPETSTETNGGDD